MLQCTLLIPLTKQDKGVVSRENIFSEFPTRSNTNRAVQPQKMVRDLKFRILEEKGLYYLFSENKGAESLIICEVTMQLICTFVFAYGKSKLSHDAAQSFQVFSHILDGIHGYSQNSCTGTKTKQRLQIILLFRHMFSIKYRILNN